MRAEMLAQAIHTHQAAAVVELAQSAATALELPLQAQLVVLEELEHLLQLLDLQ
jgi:hypothetical protein